MTILRSLALIGVLAFGLHARASAAPSASKRPTVVLLQRDGDDSGRRKRIVEALRAHLVGVPVELRLETTTSTDVRTLMREAASVAKRANAVGVLWIDATSGAELVLYVFEPGGLRLLIRRIPSANEGAAVEETALIARGTTEALLEGRQIGMEPLAESAAAAAPAAASSAPKPVRTPEPRTAPPGPRRSAPIEPPKGDKSSRRFHLGASYVGVMFAHRQAGSDSWQNGAAIAADTEIGPMHAGLEYQFLEPLVAASEGATIQLARHPLSARLGYRSQPSPLLWVLEATVMGDVVHRETVQTGGGTHATPSADHAFATLGIRLGAGYPVLPHLACAVALRFEVLVNPTEYVIGPSELLYQPTRYRPSLELGVWMDVP